MRRGLREGGPQLAHVEFEGGRVASEEANYRQRTELHADAYARSGPGEPSVKDEIVAFATVARDSMPRDDGYPFQCTDGNDFALPALAVELDQKDGAPCGSW